MESTHPTARGLRCAVSGLMLGLLLALHAAAVLPALHHFWHGDDDHSECHESDCVVLAFANGSIDPGPTPGPVIRPVFLAASDAVSIIDVAIVGCGDAEPPGRGPPIL